jgi:hypothetical protein
MPFLGLTREKSANRKSIAILLTELAKIDSTLWRRPLDERKVLVESMRITCSVPDTLGNLDPQTIQLITKGDGRKTAEAFADAAQWIEEAEEFIQRVGEAKLDAYHKSNPVATLNDDLVQITSTAEKYLLEQGSGSFSLDFLEETVKRKAPTLADHFIDTAFSNFECQIQKQVLNKGADCHWSKAFPTQHLAFMRLKEQPKDGDAKQRLLQIIAVAVSSGSAEISKLIDE